MSNFRFELIKKDPNLDLTGKQLELTDAMNYINDGKKRAVYKGVGIISIDNVEKHSFELEVTLGPDSLKSWRQNIGKYLAKHKNMQNFCSINVDKKKDEMFSIKEI